MNQTKGKKKTILRIILVIALIGIGVGIVRVWKSFKSFEKFIITEKDTQIGKRLRLEDANLQTTIDNFIREAKSPYGKSLDKNPIYAGTIVYQKGKYIKALSDYEECEIVPMSKTEEFVICQDKDDQVYVAYQYRKKDYEYYFLISLENLLNDVIGTEQDSEEMNFLMDCDGKIIVYKSGEEIGAMQAKTIPANENIKKCSNILQQYVNSTEKKATSITLKNEEGKEYTARMVVRAYEKSNNNIFAIAKTSNYNDAIKTSLEAANKILLYGIVVVMGIAIILFVFFIIQKNASVEMQNIRKRTETLEEINRKMQALSHHQRLETIGTMTAGIAHDFNNLLTPIMGYSMMTMEKLPKGEEELQENLMEIYKATNKAKDIVARLAELTRKSDSSSYENININEIIINTIKVSYPVKPKNVDVIERLDSESIQIRGDKTQISQMVLNFTLNAYDALSETGGKFMIMTEDTDKNIKIHFVDNGPGMDAETVSKIFDPFFTTKESGKGTGLGLAIIAQIAETHNAKIYVDSEIGTGTKFTVVFDRIKI